MKIVKINRIKDITIKELIKKGIEVSDIESFIELQKRLFKLDITWCYSREAILETPYKSIFIEESYTLCNNCTRNFDIKYTTKDLVENYNIFRL